MMRNGTLPVIATACLLVSLKAGSIGVYQEPDAFIREVFAGDVPRAGRLWIKKDLREQITAIMEHDLAAIRIRYWGRDRRTVWILEEIGKYEPITVGIVVNDNRIERISILVFRETRGYEVRYPFFTRQFEDAALTPGLDLDQHIDGITGATMSVNAVSKLARLALLLHTYTRFSGN